MVEDLKTTNNKEMAQLIETCVGIPRTRMYSKLAWQRLNFLLRLHAKNSHDLTTLPIGHEFNSLDLKIHTHHVLDPYDKCTNYPTY